MENNKGRFGAFEGVFTPTFLTIIGVMMYLRLGWVVGNAGFGGAILILILAKVVTITTGISIASMATNVKIGHGGNYAFITRSLGAEVGSAIGIPLYMSQALGGALYIAGFTEGWLSIFPLHHPQIVASAVLLIIFIISVISAKFAMKIQYLIMTIIVMSLVSIFSAKTEGTREVVLWGSFQHVPFWTLFAVFFPAVTGIESGTSMSGDLKDPGKALPIGILSAVLLSMFVYAAVAFWLAYIAPSEVLATNYTILLEVSRWKMIVLAGILGATFSSALGVIVAAPRVLYSLARDKVIPFSRFFSRLSKNQEPRYAIIFTVIFIEVSVLLGDLNTIAPIMTEFFLITYGVMNLAVVIEKGIQIPSFRPTFNPPIIIPLIGCVWSFVIMFIINPIFAAGALLTILIVYLIQLRRGLSAPFGDVRSGLFIAIAEWAAKLSTKMPQSAKTWKPNLMVPIEDPKNWVQIIDFIRDIIFPVGTLRVFSVNLLDQKSEYLAKNHVHEKNASGEEIILTEGEESHLLQDELDELIEPIKEEGVFTAAKVIEAYEFLEGMSIITQVMRGLFFPPNVVFMTKSWDSNKDDALNKMLSISLREQMGIMVLALHPKVGFLKKENVNVWLRSRSPNRNLAILTALQLRRNWGCKIRLFSVESNETDKQRTEGILREVIELARMPVKTQIEIFLGDFSEIIKTAPKADLNIFGASKDLNARQMHVIADMINTSCLFVKDSGTESVLA